VLFFRRQAILLSVIIDSPVPIAFINFYVSALAIRKYNRKIVNFSFSTFNPHLINPLLSDTIALRSCLLIFNSASHHLHGNPTRLFIFTHLLNYGSNQTSYIRDLWNGFICLYLSIWHWYVTINVCIYLFSKHIILTGRVQFQLLLWKHKNTVYCKLFKHEVYRY
jgi:hypothetical protein